MTWPICERENYVVNAGRLQHTVPCWGYVFHEREQTGALDMARVMQSPLGSMRAGPWLRTLKEGGSVTADDGTVIRHADVCGPIMKGRKVVRVCVRS